MGSAIDHLRYQGVLLARVFAGGIVDIEALRPYDHELASIIDQTIVAPEVTPG